MYSQGSIPGDWGVSASFPNLQKLYLSFNHELTGQLPDSWGSDGSSFKNLTQLDITNNGLTGPLPKTWAANLPALDILSLSANALTGANFAHIQAYSRICSIPGGDTGGSWILGLPLSRDLLEEWGVCAKIPATSRATLQVTVKLAIVPLSLQAGLRAYLVCTRLLKLEKWLNIHTHIAGLPTCIYNTSMSCSQGNPTSMTVQRH